MIIVGDSNLKHPCLNPPNDTRINSETEYLIDNMLANNLTVINDGQVTRISPTLTIPDSAIDLILVSAYLQSAALFAVPNNSFGGDHLLT